jgi:hypothetical protein
LTGARAGCFGAVPTILLNSGNILAGDIQSTNTYIY